MDDFDWAQATYSIGNHPVRRYRQRVIGEHVDICYADVQQLVQADIDKGYVFLEQGRHRYIRSGNLFIPCIRFAADQYVVKSILLWDSMVARERDVIFRGIIQN